MFNGNTPAPGTPEHARNERIIDKSPFLKKMRSQSQGESYTEIKTQVASDQYRANFDKIDWSKK